MTQSFSAMWSDRLGDALRLACTEPYPISCWPGSEDFQALATAINVGIDAHLEAVTFEQGADHRGAPRFTIAVESLPVLIRRLLEGDGIAADDEEAWNSALDLASGICQTLNIELV